MQIEPHSDDVALLGPDAPAADQIDDLLRLLVTIRHRWGNTAVRYRIQWGANALWANDAQKRRIEALEDALEKIVGHFPQRKMVRPHVTAARELLAQRERRSGEPKGST